MNIRGSPFNYLETKSAQPNVQPRNYSEVFDPKEYECKTDIELESYQRNLRNYLLSLLSQDPFPAGLFDKLEKRLDGIVSLLEKRYAASGVSVNKKSAEERLKALDQRLAKIDASAQPQEKLEPEDLEPPKKRQRTEPEYVQEVRKNKSALDRLKRSYTDLSQEP